MPGKGKFPREEGFLRGPILQRKWGSECFWGSVLSKFALLTRDEFQKVTLGATYVSTKCKFSDIICSKSNVGRNDNPCQDDGSTCILPLSSQGL